MSIAPQPPVSGKTPRRTRGNVRSFVWTPENGDEITACNDCRFWHASVSMETDEYGISDVEIREWHEADCPVFDDPVANT